MGVPAESQVSGAEVAAVVDLFRGAGLECQPREDIEAVLWEKLVINAGINPLTALLRVLNGALLQLPEAWEVAVAAAQEVQAVARATGLSLSGDPASRLRQVCTDTAANRSSMLQDILAGRPTEIEALNAQVSSRGRALGAAHSGQRPAHPSPPRRGPVRSPSGRVAARGDLPPRDSL